MHKFKIAIYFTFSILFIIGCNDNNENNIGKDEGKAKVTKVETEILKSVNFKKQINVKGIVKPVNKAFISARTGGIIDSLYVKEGDYVKKSDLLFQTDKKNLENAVVSAKKMYDAALKMQEYSDSDIPVSHANKEKIELDYKRDKDLYKNEAISKSDFERTEVSYKSAIAGVKKAEAFSNATKSLTQQLAASLNIAEKNLADSKVLAPYDGYIVSKKMNSGEYAMPGAPVLEIENTGELEIACRISAVYYEDIIIDKTYLNIEFAGKTLATTPVSYKSPNIDNSTRTFEIKSFIPIGKNIISGLLCDVNIVLEQHQGVGLSTNTIIPHKDEKYVVYAIESGKAIECEVKIGLSTDNMTEIINSEDLSGKKIISSGHFYLNNGDLVEENNGGN